MPPRGPGCTENVPRPAGPDPRDKWAQTSTFLPPLTSKVWDANSQPPESTVLFLQRAVIRVTSVFPCATAPFCYAQFPLPVLLSSQVGFLHHFCAGAEAERFSDGEQVPSLVVMESKERALGNKDLTLPKERSGLCPQPPGGDL